MGLLYLDLGVIRALQAFGDLVVRRYVLFIALIFLVSWQQWWSCWGGLLGLTNYRVFLRLIYVMTGGISRFKWTIAAVVVSLWLGIWVRVPGRRERPVIVGICRFFLCCSAQIILVFLFLHFSTSIFWEAYGHVMMFDDDGIVDLWYIFCTSGLLECVLRSMSAFSHFFWTCYFTLVGRRDARKIFH